MNDHGERAPFLAVLLIVAWAVAGVLYACSLTGCASVRDGVVDAVNASSDYLTEAQKGLSELDRQEQDECIRGQSDPRIMMECTAKVHAKYHAAWSAYRTCEARWIAAAGTVKVYDARQKAGQQVDTVAMMAASAELAAATEAFTKATAALVDTVKK